MTDDPLFVSPYLLQPLRSFEEALRDRQRARPAKPGELPSADHPASRVDAQTVPNVTPIMPEPPVKSHGPP